jgi:alkylation response protein AidB-like acyl-CoA dehydrogenase
MTFAISPEQRDYRAAVRAAIRAPDGAVAANSLLAESGQYDPAWWRRISAELCLPGLIVPEESGGQGRPLCDLALALEEAGRALVGGHLLVSCGPVAALLGAVAPGSAALRQLAAGRARIGLALGQPPGDGERLPAVSADRTGTGAVLTGRAATVVGAWPPEQLLIAAQRSRSDGADPLVVLVDMSSPGVRLKMHPGIDTARPTYAAEFEEADAPVLADGTAAGDALGRALDVGAACVAAESAGATAQALADIVAFTSSRIQFGAPIGTLQAIRHRCADLLVEAEHALTASRYAAWTADAQPQLFPLAASMAKAYATDAFEHAAREHLQLHGGIGFTMEHDSHVFVRRAKSCAWLFGSASWHRARLLALARGRHGPVPPQADA